jgi:hypothetical protein
LNRGFQRETPAAAARCGKPRFDPDIPPAPGILVRLRRMSVKRLYKIIFMTQGQVYEIYAREVGHGTLFGFIEIEKLVFGERSSVVVDPSEEKIQSEFAGVKRTYLPMHSIIRIDEVDKQGTSKISKLEGGNVAQFPVPVYTPGGGSNKS